MKYEICKEKKDCTIVWTMEAKNRVEAMERVLEQENILITEKIKEDSYGEGHRVDKDISQVA